MLSIDHSKRKTESIEVLYKFLKLNKTNNSRVLFDIFYNSKLSHSKTFEFMSLLKDFKDFAMRGNVIDLAVGIIIGIAFGKIIASLVADIVMPPLGLLIGGVNFTDLKLVMKPAEMVDGIQKAAVTMNYGNFLQVTFDFLIVAFAVFIFIRLLNKFNRKKEVPITSPELTKEVTLLTEIRDLLKK